jgi:hypothetical protein
LAIPVQTDLASIVLARDELTDAPEIASIHAPINGKMKI